MEVGCLWNSLTNLYQLKTWISAEFWCSRYSETWMLHATAWFSSQIHLYSWRTNRQAHRVHVDDWKCSLPCLWFACPSLQKVNGRSQQPSLTTSPWQSSWSHLLYQNSHPTVLPASDSGSIIFAQIELGLCFVAMSAHITIFRACLPDIEKLMNHQKHPWIQFFYRLESWRLQARRGTVRLHRLADFA